MSGKFRKILCASTIIAGFVLTASAVSAGPKTPSISVPNISPSRPDINLRAPNILREQNADDDRSSQTKTRKSLTHRENTHKTTAKKKNVNEKNVGSTGGNSTKVIIPPAKIIPPAVRLNEPGPDIGDRVGKAERARRDAGAAGNLQGNSGAEATMRPAATVDPLTGDTGIHTVGWMEELCKHRSLRALGLCAGFQDGSRPVVDPKTGEVHYNTESPVRPGGRYHGPTGFDAARAGDRVPSHDGPASDDEGKPVQTVRHADGSTTELYQTRRDNADGTHTWTDHVVDHDANKNLGDQLWIVFTGPDHNNGEFYVASLTAGEIVRHIDPVLHVHDGRTVIPIHIDDQPGRKGSTGRQLSLLVLLPSKSGKPELPAAEGGV